MRMKSFLNLPIKRAGIQWLYRHVPSVKHGHSSRLATFQWFGDQNGEKLNLKSEIITWYTISYNFKNLVLHHAIIKIDK